VSLTRSGSLLREASLANATGPAVVSPSGLLFSPGADWVVGAYRFEPEALGRELQVKAPPYGDDPGAAATAESFDPGLLDSGHRLALLDTANVALDSGQLGEAEGAAASMAEAIALGRFDRQYSAAEAPFRQDPLPRSRALALLGRLGSPDRVGVLVEVFKKDADPAVRAAACYAIGAIARDPDGVAGAAFVAAARRGLPDEVALALVNAVSALALRSGSQPGREALKALLALTAAPYGPDVKNAAVKALGRIAGAIGP
jgi:HEAT repeat protein